MPTCRDAQVFCNNDTIVGLRTRQLCSQTCGCAEPRGLLALWQPSQGCPPSCHKIGRFGAALDGLPCKDVQRDDTDLVAYLDSWEKVAQTWPSSARSSSNHYISELRSFGCDYLRDSTKYITMPPYLTGKNLCITAGINLPVKPLSYFCPSACGCHSEDIGCPRSCLARNASDQLCPAHQRQCRAWGSPRLSNTCPSLSTINKTQNESYTRFCPLLL